MNVRRHVYFLLLGGVTETRYGIVIRYASHFLHSTGIISIHHMELQFNDSIGKCELRLVQGYDKIQ